MPSFLANAPAACDGVEVSTADIGMLDDHNDMCSTCVSACSGADLLCLMSPRMYVYTDYVG